MTSDLQLDDYELCIAADLIDSRDLNTDWSNIGGLQSTIDDIRQQVLAPFKRRLFQSALVKPPKGQWEILLNRPKVSLYDLVKLLRGQSGCHHKVKCQISQRSYMIYMYGVDMVFDCNAAHN